MTVKIKWLYQTQMLPGIGLAERNKNIDLPKDMADDFIKQGKAVMTSKAKTAKPEEEND